MCAECHSTGVRKNYDAANDRFATTLGGDQRRLRGLPRPGLAPRRLGARPATAGGRSARPRIRTKGCWFASTSAGTSSGGTIRAPAMPQRSFAPAAAAQGGRDLRALPRAPRRIFRGLGARADGCRTRTWSRRSPRALSRRRADARRGLQLRLVQAEQDVRGRRHLQRLPRAAQRQAARCRATASACNATRPTNTRRQRITTTTASNPPLACASCHMPARTYMVVDRRHDHSFRIPRPDLSARLGTPERLQRLPCRQIGAMGGGGHRELARPRPQGLPELRRRRSTPHGRTEPDAAALLAAVGVGSQRAGIRARQRADRACPARVAGEHRSRAQRPCRSRPDGADRRARHAGQRAGRRSSGRWSRRSCPIPIAGVRIRAVALLAAVPAASQPARRPRTLRARRRRIRRRPAPQRRSAGSARDARQFLCAARPHGRGGGRIQSRAAAQPAICAGGDQPRRSLPAD